MEAEVLGARVAVGEVVVLAFPADRGDRQRQGRAGPGREDAAAPRQQRQADRGPNQDDPDQRRRMASRRRARLQM